MTHIGMKQDEHDPSVIWLGAYRIGQIVLIRDERGIADNPEGWDIPCVVEGVTLSVTKGAPAPSAAAYPASVISVNYDLRQVTGEGDEMDILHKGVDSSKVFEI